MGVKYSGLAMWAVFVAAFPSSATGTACEEITFQPCTGLSSTPTGFPNSLGHESLDQVPLSLTGTFQHLMIIGCHDDIQLFLCAAAFPRCTGSGRMLTPCRSFCENVLMACRPWFGQYAEIFAAVDCSHMPNSDDPSVCVRPKLSSSPVASVTNNRPSEQAHMATVFRTKYVKIRSPVAMENSTMLRLATPFPRQPTPKLVHTDKDLNKKVEDQYQRGTLLNNAQLTSGVKGHMSTGFKGDPILIQSVDKSAEMDQNLQDEFQDPISSFGVILAVMSCVVMVLLLISCTFLRKVFRKPHGGRRPRDGAFYTNPAFSDLPHSTPHTSAVNNGNGELAKSPHQRYTVADLPPHPASTVAPPTPKPSSQSNIYQQEPDGYIEQNLFVVPQSPPNVSNNLHQERDDSKNAEMANTQAHPDVTSDLVYTNAVTSAPTDTNGNEHNAELKGRGTGNNGNVTAPSMVDPVALVSESVDSDDMVIVNPIAC